MSRLDLAALGVGGVRDRVDHRLALRRGAFAGSSERASGGAALPGDDVARTAAAHESDVRGGLVVDPAETHLGDRPRRRGDRAAALLGAIPECASRPMKRASMLYWLGASSTIPPIGEAWSKTKPIRACSRSWSNALAPSRPTSSCTVSTSSMPACGRPSVHDLADGVQHRRDRRLVVGPRIVASLVADAPHEIGSIGASVRHRVHVGAEESGGAVRVVAGIRQ